MTNETLGFALAAGTLAAVNPFGFAMLPAYLSLVVAVADTQARRSAWAAVGRALTATASTTLGFGAVFGLFGWHSPRSPRPCSAGCR